MAGHSAHYLDISIHAPREGSDFAISGRFLMHFYFYPRSPRGERRRRRCVRLPRRQFLSTLPARGATNAFSTAE